MANLVDTETRARFILARPDATPDEILGSMKEVLDAKKPFLYSLAHGFEKLELRAIGEKNVKNFVDVLEEEQSEYSKWIDGWRNGANAKTDYPNIVAVGKGILRAELDIPQGRIADSSLLRDYAVGRVEKAKEAAGKAVTFVGRAATKATSDLGEILFKLAIGYFIVQAISGKVLGR